MSPGLHHLKMLCWPLSLPHARASMPSRVLNMPAHNQYSLCKYSQKRQPKPFMPRSLGRLLCVLKSMTCWSDAVGERQES
ncbi:hypothetical protein BJ165DRAFT_1513114 [Panaeolus papilionaceus]|nr:hypothetical protein BJ165DRAFT_1513114 [Panaeolus papilionaceus]